VLHVGFLLPAMLAGLSTYALARRFCKRPLLACAATICAPAFVVSGTSLMLDMWLLALFVGALALWVEGFERGQTRWLIAACGVAGLAMWTKYFGVALVPLFVLYGALKFSRPKWWLACLLIPISMIAVEQTWCYYHYGHLLFRNVADVVFDQRIQNRSMWAWLLIGFAFTGGCTFSIMQLGAVLWKGRVRLLGLLIWVAFALVLAGLGRAGNGVLTGGFDLPIVSSFVCAILVLGGTQLVTLSLCEIRHRGEPESWLLVAWIAGTFIFACFVTWSVNARSLLPLVPAAAIIAARRLDYLSFVNVRRANFRMLLALVLSGVISLLVARADMTWAQSQRLAAERFRERAVGFPGTVYYQGHWGFQHYMTEAGFKHFELDRTVLLPGDIVISPQNNSNVTPLPREYVEMRTRETVAIDRRIATMSLPLGAGFYSDLWGPMPFSLGLAMPPDAYYLDYIAQPR